MPAPTKNDPHKAHMTWASHTVSGAAKRTTEFLRQRAWLWPLIAVVLLSTIALLVRGAVERTMKDALTSELEHAAPTSKSRCSRPGSTEQERNAVSIANDVEIRELVQAT